MPSGILSITPTPATLRFIVIVFSCFITLVLSLVTGHRSSLSSSDRGSDFGVHHLLEWRFAPMGDGLCHQRLAVGERDALATTLDAV